MKESQSKDPKLIKIQGLQDVQQEDLLLRSVHNTKRMCCFSAETPWGTVTITVN